AYDPLDPNGKITVTFDTLQFTDDGYVARVTIQNYYQYRHIDKPGWNLGWIWTRKEVIWSMSGAFATQQGNCLEFKYKTAHSCKIDPVISDHMPDAQGENRTENCCNGGVLSSWAINPNKSSSSFEITIGNLNGNSSLFPPPSNLTLISPGPGYSCGPIVDVKPTVFPEIGGKREVQVYRTWKSTCTYSSFVANKAPTCCVSFSSFYSPTFTSCPLCSCGCKQADETALVCNSSNVARSELQCTDHMCPVGVHWHIKTNYREHWRVKMTVSNYNLGVNYTDWNVLVQHPGFNKSSLTYSFNSMLLPTAGFADDVALFSGILSYNDKLLQADQKHVGSVSTEILMAKDLDQFTLHNGWAFPRRIYFNGENCEMALPDTFPMLPSGNLSCHPSYHLFVLLIVLHLISQALFQC
ncbi:hypothetical protein GIB67_020022, partial [Kingdonia uniflora]